MVETGKMIAIEAGGCAPPILTPPQKREMDRAHTSTRGSCPWQSMCGNTDGKGRAVMAIKPITFSAPMVRALLAGTKTQTRRLLRTPVPADANGVHAWFAPPEVPTNGIPNQWAQSGLWAFKHMDEEDPENCSGGYNRYCGPLPYRPGDRVYVREAYYQFGHWEPVEGKQTKGGRQKWTFVGDHPLIVFDAPEEHRLGRHHKDPATPAWHKRLGRFMARGNSRMWLDITDVRVQRLQDISEADCVAEGIQHVTTTASGEFYQNFQNPQCPLMAYGAYRSLWDHINGEGAWADNPWIVAYTFTVHEGNVDAA